MSRRVRAASVQDPPAPWKRRGVHAVGGLTDVGFGRGSDLLLVVSTSGRGVIDCTGGLRVARDPSVPGPGEDDWQDTFELEVEGIGPLAGQRVRTAGLFGGGLARCTRDGWTVERLALDWPEASLLLLPPGAWIYETRPGRSAEFTKVAVESEVRAWGFSPTGRSLVIATSSDVTVFGR
ncbi:hypothetical protein [Polyangium spumosum]|uniref:Uncharacterized protein n=1 Tax=Polyangium spumosum TaxID=889282 RepID=A0A6N7PSR8_9BACT|nr:hypothetical protein [Polyangium spumosum]MRG93420.1 hypothetical protein [Polyangium spumosum]